MALPVILLCLFGDFDIQSNLDSASTVSLYVTIGSDSISSILQYSFLRSFKQISTWSSPHPAITYSPVSS